MKEEKLINTKLNILKGGVSMDAILSVFRAFDRMPDNQNFPSKEFIQRVIDLYGYITLFVFVCPKIQPKYLKGMQKEKFIPLEEPKNGLLFPRIPKLKELVTSLWKAGIPSKLIFCVGDNGFELWRGPVVGMTIDKTLADTRRELYIQNLGAQLSKDFPQMVEVLSLGLTEIGVYTGTITIAQEIRNEEIEYQLKESPKYYSVELSAYEARSIADLKIKSYAEQGYLVESADAILIGTEGSDSIDSWALSTKLLMSGGANFPSIYPYIRKETIGE